MATLEKIRSKSVFLIVIIAVALLAFILGDLITNWGHLFGNNTTVAKIGDEKIEITDYQQKHQELNQQLEMMKQQNPGAVSNYDMQLLSQQAIDQLIDERLKGNAVNALQLKPTGELLKFYMIEHPERLSREYQAKLMPQYQQLLQSMVQSGLPVNSPEDAYMIIFNPKSVKMTEQQIGPYKRAWLNLEAQFATAIAESMYDDLLVGSFKANALDVAAAKKEYSTTANVKVAKKGYQDVDENKYKVSDDEIKKAYEEKKNRYAVDELTKEIGFIAVNVTPSAADIQAANAISNQVLSQLKAGNELSKELKKEGLTIIRHEQKLSDVEKANVALASFLENARIDSVGMVKSNITGFEIAKLTGRSNEVDTIEVQTVMLSDVALVPEVLGALNGGVNPDSVSSKYDEGKVMASPATKIPLYTAQGKSDLGISDNMRDSLMNSTGKYIVLEETQEYATLAKIVSKSNPTSVVSYEVVNYDLHPSDATIEEARTKLQDFLNANPDSQKFMANAQNAGYYPMTIELTSSNPAVPAGGSRLYPESRSVVRWVMIDGKNGEVSKIFQTRDIENPMLYAAAVVDTYEEYKPWNNQAVKDELTREVRNSKAADDMIKQYSGKGSIEATAQAMGVESQEVPSLRSTGYSMVSDKKVVGKILGSKPSKQVHVVKGDDAVYAFVIENVTEEQPVMSDDDFANMFNGIHRKDVKKMLRGAKKVKNNIYKFEQGE